MKATSLANMDNVHNDIREAQKSCVKLPEISFVLFYKGNPDLEIEGFNKVRQGIIDIL
jgi:hypothetical protein